MWRLKYVCAVLPLFVLFATVKGSCLEYGHSCWGGHGKRSDGKVQRIGSNLPSNVLEFLVEGSKKQKLLNALNDLNHADERETDVVVNNAEARLEITPTKDNVKYNEPIRMRRFKLYHQQKEQRQSQQPQPQQPQHQQQQQQQQQDDERVLKRNNFSMDESAERWRRLPLYKYKYSPPEPEQLGGDGASLDENIYYELK